MPSTIRGRIMSWRNHDIGMLQARKQLFAAGADERGFSPHAPACSSRIFSHSVIAGSSSMARTPLLAFQTHGGITEAKTRNESMHKVRDTLQSQYTTAERGLHGWAANLSQAESAVRHLRRGRLTDSAPTVRIIQAHVESDVPESPRGPNSSVVDARRPGSCGAFAHPHGHPNLLSAGAAPRAAKTKTRCASDVGPDIYRMHAVWRFVRRADSRRSCCG